MLDFCVEGTGEYNNAMQRHCGPKDTADRDFRLQGRGWSEVVQAKLCNLNLSWCIAV